MNHFRTSLGFLILLTAIAGASGPVTARGDEFADRAVVRERYESIMNSPDFRQFRGRRDSGQSVGDFRRQGDNGQGDPNGRNPADGEQGNPPQGDRNNRRPNDRNQGGGERPPQRPRQQPPPQRDPQREPIEIPRSTFGSFGSGAGAVFQFIGWIVIGVMVALITYMIYAAIRDRERTVAGELVGGGAFDVGELDVEHPPGELPADVYVARARALAAEGRFRDAVAQLMLGAMSQLERHGWVRYRKGMTQRDYLRAVRNRQDVAAAFKQLLKIYEPLGFGRRNAAHQHFDDALTHYSAGFHDRPAPPA